MQSSRSFSVWNSALPLLKRRWIQCALDHRPGSRDCREVACLVAETLGQAKPTRSPTGDKERKYHLFGALIGSEHCQHQVVIVAHSTHSATRNADVNKWAMVR